MQFQQPIYSENILNGWNEKPPRLSYINYAWNV